MSKKSKEQSNQWATNTTTKEALIVTWFGIMVFLKSRMFFDIISIYWRTMMRKKKFTKHRFYKRLEAQDLSDAINIIKYKASLGLVGNNSLRAASTYKNARDQIKRISSNLDKIISMKIANRAIVRAITEDRIQQIIYGK
ncbi:hypothetical protein [Acinetobacter baumannii]|uniref:hypothetical protein n=1 Tax=Acinetobacter baumannii TaxID=470 RepID=UPI0019D273F6|nr:hypothetical protein [Acinetobacter baumannii]